ncbi:class II fumarate hydratase [Halorhodospira neutriphila]|uniref:Fumarate hydratase class II n=1 Tax=Halorhodospira neutriphila TaxID=168379 RepID=A0ABS1E4R2_9GAMM|nr:class II fumarate hydratase [Halorhodospira neutriphila]MBK1726485.1 aspartate ammonia-lyase [Halorhodospira neutriphila]
MSQDGYRTERDSMGELQVPADALYGAQTQRAVENFPVSGKPMPRAFIQALGLIKAACARANRDLAGLDPAIAEAVADAAEAVSRGDYDAHFPVDVFQTGSGTSSNMNANEVIARLASERSGCAVHPNDHVNMGQSSNDVIPTAIHVSAAMEAHDRLLPALRRLADGIDRRSEELAEVTTTGRTHLMDAMPVTLGQELSGWAAQVRSGVERIEATLPRVHALAQGGTAVGTGINAHPELGERVATLLAQATGIPFAPAANRFEALSSQDSAVELSGQLRSVAVALMKIANDLRWMNSGPLAGLGEIALPALQPGSSIMPGKVNPVVPESVAMVSAQVMGNDTTVSVAGQSGNFQLNVMLPVIAANLLESIALLSNAATILGRDAIGGFTVNEDNLRAALDRNPILVTALNAAIGYERGAEVAKRAYQQGRPVIEVAREMTDLGEEELQRLLDPRSLTRGGLPE